MTPAKRKPKTAEQKERDRSRKIEYRKENAAAIREANKAKWAARETERQARRDAERLATRQRELWRQYERAWIAETKPRFPDWRSLAAPSRQPEYSRAKTLEYYHRLSPEQKRERNAKRRLREDPQDRREKGKQWRLTNANRVRENQKRWLAANPDRARELRRQAEKRMRANPRTRALLNLRKRLKVIMRELRLSITGKRKLIGCTIEQFTAHMEKQWKPGMTWENYGTRWHVDHIIPCAKFDHTIPTHVQQCWHYTNLQPLWAEDNLAKSDKLNTDI